jgi:hypothetical protein
MAAARRASTRGLDGSEAVSPAPGIEISIINSNFRQPVEQLFVTQRTRSSVVGLPVNSMAVNLDV